MPESRHDRLRRQLESPISDPGFSLFLNCSYDDGFEEHRNAIVIAATSCGFVPKVAATAGTAVPRIRRILECIESCRYSIHDLTLHSCHDANQMNHARLNMPFELGLAVGHSEARHPDCGHREWLVIAAEGSDLTRALSDLNGFDTKLYGDDPGSLISPVMNWLWTLDGALSGPTPRQVRAALPTFSQKLGRLKDEWDGGEIPWRERLIAAWTSVPE